MKDLAIAAAAVITGLWMAMLSWVARREVLRIDAKADRSEVMRLMTLMEKRDEEARDSRRRLHEKLDASSAALSEFKVEVARFMGRQNGP